MSCFFDPQKRRLLVLHQNQCLVVPASEIELPEQPWLGATLSRSNLEIETEHTIEVRPNSDQVQLKISRLPYTASFEKNVIKWRPNPSEIGIRNIYVTSTLQERFSKRQV